ncbi:MAG: hypothetical protein CL554_18840 [Algoriphagus sp.]|uniref:hypothetical protein n=1 Tax=Algoriphagus sp. TaxID=1872435 RepID=UPI000C4370EC|nr:hypothetical protein [Algoriphagus sp.]MAL15471.1 hypothetical protein [Algoriphagus sp.]
MINLWYEESYWAHAGGRVTGPEKVVRSTIEALTQEGIDFSINEDKYSYNFLLQYQHDLAYKKHECLEHDSCVIGPQFWPFDSYGEFLIDNPQFYKKLIAPSYWVEDVLVSKFNVSSDKVSIWAAPIKAPEIIDNISIDCLIYHKSRPDKNLEKIKTFLTSRGITYTQLNYGGYSQNDFKDALSKVKFCIIIDSTESQGIAIQEMMAAGKPLLVWDVKEWDYMGQEYKVPSTSVPYWSGDCGEKFYNSDELEFTFNKFYDKMDEYDPKKLIDSELSYKVSVEKLLKIFEE